MPWWSQLPRKEEIHYLKSKAKGITGIAIVSTIDLTDVGSDDVLQVLLAVVQLLLQLGEFQADHIQVALVVALQSVHDKRHVADLRDAIDPFSVDNKVKEFVRFYFCGTQELVILRFCAKLCISDKMLCF